MSQAAVVQFIQRTEPTGDANIVSAIYTGLVLYTNTEGAETQEDVIFAVMFNKNATADQIEIAIRDALKKKAQEVTGTTWANNDIYQSQVRRG